MNKKNRAIDPIGWSLQNPFPAIVVAGEQYEAVYQLVSKLPAQATLTVTYTGGSDFTVEDRCSGLFVPGQTCNVTVRFSPSSTGVQQFQLTLHYFNDVVPLPVQTMTVEGSTTLIVGSVTQALPATTVVESIYPIIFTFQNMSGSAATNLDLQRNYPADFTEENNTCSTTLAAGASCIVQGSLIPSAPGNYEVAADLYYAESVTPASVSTPTDAIVITVTGAVTTRLPGLTVVGDSFPVVFAYTNNSDLPATSVNITTNYPPGFTQQSDNCTGTLNAHSSCTLQGTFTPTTPGVFNVAVSLAYAESSNPVPLSTSTTADVGALGIVGDVTTPLPVTTSINVSYPVIFAYTNEGSITATGLNITTNYPPEFTQQSNSCSGSLRVGSVCTVTGTLLPTSAENYTVGVSLSYDQSINPVPLSTITSAIVVDITGVVDTTLPTITAINTSYPVVFSYINNSSITATSLVLTPNYPAGFTENNNTCASGTLASGQTCRIEGNFIPARSGTHTVATSLTYAGAPTSIPVFTSTSTLEFVLTGEVSTQLPETLELGNGYPVVFTYTNANPLPATNLLFTPNYPTDFMQETNTCRDTLPSNASCSVSGTLIPSSNTPPGPVSVKLDLTYSEGSPIELTTGSEIASQVDISGNVTGLPPVTIASTTPLPVTFEFDNSGNAPTTGLNLRKNYPPEFNETSNTCTGALAANAGCKITGNLDISRSGNYLVSVTLNTNEAAPVLLTTKTSVIAAEVIGFVAQKLPVSTVVGTSYPVTFLFTNESAVDATTVNIDTNYPTDFAETSNTCGATLAAHATCEIKGTLTPTSQGSQTVTLSFQYAEAEDDDISLSTFTTVGTLVLQGFMQQGFPDVADINTPYPLIFKYTNPNPGTATGLNITSTPGLIITLNTCNGGTLAEGASCTVEANFMPTQIDLSAGVTLSYDQGAPISLNTYTVVGTSLLIVGGEAGFLRTTPNWRKWTVRDQNRVELTGSAFSPKLQRYVLVGKYNSSDVDKGFFYYTQDGMSFNSNKFSFFIPINIIWNSDLSQFLIIGAQGGIATSTDGETWVKQTSPVSDTLNSAIWSPQQRQYVVVGSRGTILTSPNGIDWQLQTSGVDDILSAVAWSPSLERYVVSTSANYVLNSTDGATWNNPGATIEFEARSITWSPALGQFALVGFNTYIATSSDGQQWQRQQSGTTKIINNVIWFSYLNKFYAVGSNTTIYDSKTGLSKWNNDSLTYFTNYSINTVVAGGVVG